MLGEEVRPATLRLEDGVIVAIEDGSADLDFGDAVLMPGLVDSHVHVNEPGRTQWEGFDTATQAAVAGGTTTVIDMPLNSIPPTVNVPALEAKRIAAGPKISVDVAFWGGLIPGSHSSLQALVEQGVCGFKAFLVDSGVAEFPPVTLSELEEGLGALASIGVPFLVHAESVERNGDLTPGTVSYEDYLASRPPESEAEAVASVSRLADLAGATAHILHVSSVEAVELIASGPDRLTGETCPHYLTFAASDIPDGATLFKCTPPIREQSHREALWEGLRRGDLSMVVSDHSPAPPGLKCLDSGDFAAAWGGISGLQVRLPVTWSGAVDRGFDLIDMARWLSTAPARLAGLDDRKGSIEVGKDADLVVFDPDGATEVIGARLFHRHPTTPYEGMSFRGRVVATLLAGSIIFDGSRVVPHRGRMLRR